MAEEHILTPGGYRPASKVYKLQPGQVLDGAGGTIKILDETGKVVADYGRVPTQGAKKILQAAPGKGPQLAHGWITYAIWTNNTGKPITAFTTAWRVPPAPLAQNGQTIFLFNGILNSSSNGVYLSQPVLQWGPARLANGEILGGNYWSVGGWFIVGDNSYVCGVTQVNEGQVLVGFITQTPSSGSFSGYCCFQGIAESYHHFQNMPELVSCVETLECYDLTICSNYPATDRTQMIDIEILTTDGNPALVWTPENQYTDCKQQTIVVSNTNPGGEVDLCYDPNWYAARGGVNG